MPTTIRLGEAVVNVGLTQGSSLSGAGSHALPRVVTMPVTMIHNAINHAGTKSTAPPADGDT